MPYKISIILAEPPAIDPNITYRFSELKSTGYDVVKTGNLRFNDEHFIKYGTTVQAELGVVDRIQIKEDYRLDEIPRFVSSDTENCIFSTSDTVIEIDKETVKDKYFVKQITDFVVVSKTILHSVYENEETAEELRQAFYQEKHHHLTYGCCYSLSINIACKMHQLNIIPSDLRVFNYFQFGESPLFLMIEKE
jgi:hypothetical protein